MIFWWIWPTLYSCQPGNNILVISPNFNGILIILINFWNAINRGMWWEKTYKFSSYHITTDRFRFLFSLFLGLRLFQNSRDRWIVFLRKLRYFCTFVWWIVLRVMNSTISSLSRWIVFLREIAVYDISDKKNKPLSGQSWWITYRGIMCDTSRQADLHSNWNLKMRYKILY
jgi:hypothetical protein